MAVQGHKERALQRRGLHIKEALQRRGSVNESAQQRRSLLIENVDALTELCTKNPDSIYCRLKDRISELGFTEHEELLRDVSIIKDFFTKDLGNRNESVFKKVVEIILNLDAFGNAIRVMASTMQRGHVILTSGETLETTKKSIRDALNVLIDSGKEITEENMEELLKNVRMIGYQEYERGFVGNNFEYIGGSWRMPNLDLEVKSFWKLVLLVYKGTLDENYLYKRMVSFIIKNKAEIFETAKADLRVLNNLKVGAKVIFPKGSYVEVKKMDYTTDSYMSEFYAIYKNSDLKTNLENEGVDEEKFMALYNRIIDNVYIYLRDNGQTIIDEAENHINGIMYDKNILIPRIDEKGQKNFEFYWSNKGQRDCSKDHRLSIRFRPLREKLVGYVYNSQTKSVQLTPQKINIDLQKPTQGVNFC